MSNEVKVDFRTYAGLFMVTLATLMYEILLTRIFSVTMWYHYAFMAISIALFGMTVGATIVYLRPETFDECRINYLLALNSLLFAVSIVASFLTHLSLLFVTTPSLVAFYTMVLTFCVISVPFVFSGICVCLALTKTSNRVGRLYAADLAGAASGCVLLVGVLGITDGPTAVVVIAALAGLGTCFFAQNQTSQRLKRMSLVCTVFLGSFAGLHTLLVIKQSPILYPLWVKGTVEPRPLFEKWNSFSRIQVIGDPNAEQFPFGWGLSPVLPRDLQRRQLHLLIDANAGTPLMFFDGDIGKHEYLKFDVTNIAHHIRRNARVLVVGTGGGRDILSALVFQQKSVLGVEINGSIIDAVNGRFGAFTGHLDKRSDVVFVNDEARSYIARLTDRFDIIQVSMIDTFAATAAGAYVLSEHSLYTVEAWRNFIEHLSPDGLLTFSRWYSPKAPFEVYRLTSLACKVLKKGGVSKPREHIVLVASDPSHGMPQGIGTLLLSKAPFSDADIDVIDRIAREMAFHVVFSPRQALDSTLEALASGRDLDAFVAKYPINIAAPTDDSPFFLDMLRLGDVFNFEIWQRGDLDYIAQPVIKLVILLIIVLFLTATCVIIPLRRTTNKAQRRAALPLTFFFASIGIGFMLIEISQMQRLIVFLGHPTYSLSTVLFSLLLSSGIGSFLSERIAGTGEVRRTVPWFGVLIATLVVFGSITPTLIRLMQTQPTTIRILVAIGLLAPVGLTLGMAFPIGMNLAKINSGSLTPWLWGINGATSVCASVLAMVIGMHWGISTSFWIGCVAYIFAVLSFLWASWKMKQ